MSQVDVAKNLAAGLDPMQQLNTKAQITNPMSRIDYVIDLTKEYRNMLSSTSYEYDLNANEDIVANTIGSVPTNVSADITASVPANTPADITASMPINASTQTFTWADEELVESSTDIAMNMSEKSGADIAAFRDSGYNFQPQNRYTFLNDDLGSAMRMSNGAGVLQATYGYDEFGQEILDGINTLKNALGKVADLVNPFGFVGYQRDNIADDYFAEAREYRPEEGRFSETDKVRGFIEMPFTLNRYGYCYNNGMLMNDLNGMCPNPIKWVKDKTKKAAKAVGKFCEKHKKIVGIGIGVATVAATAGLIVATGGIVVTAIVAAPAIVSSPSVESTAAKMEVEKVTESALRKSIITNVVFSSVASGFANVITGEKSFDNFWDGATSGAINGVITSVGGAFNPKLGSEAEKGLGKFILKSSGINVLAGFTSGFYSSVTSGNNCLDAIKNGVISGCTQGFFSGVHSGMYDSITDLDTLGRIWIGLHKYACDIGGSTVLGNIIINSLDKKNNESANKREVEKK